jgi:hypothetical protein
VRGPTLPDARCRMHDARTRSFGQAWINRMIGRRVLYNLSQNPRRGGVYPRPQAAARANRKAGGDKPLPYICLRLNPSPVIDPDNIQRTLRTSFETACLGPAQRPCLDSGYVLPTSRRPAFQRASREEPGTPIRGESGCQAPPLNAVHPPTHKEIADQTDRRRYSHPRSPA